jgi:hypothetical protein
MYLLDMVKEYITRTRASIKGAVLKARDTAGRDLRPGRLIYLLSYTGPCTTLRKLVSSLVGQATKVYAWSVYKRRQAPACLAM